MKKTFLILIFLIPAPSIAHEYYSSYKENKSVMQNYIEKSTFKVLLKNLDM